MALLTVDERAMQIQRILSLQPSDSGSRNTNGGGVLLTASDKILSPQKQTTADTATAITTLPNLQEIDAGPRGALRALPILYICLGGEMLYVIKHRLEAQNLMSKAQRGSYTRVHAMCPVIVNVQKMPVCTHSGAGHHKSHDTKTSHRRNVSAPASL